MIREIVKANNEYINIKVPQEYIGKELEVLVFSNSEIIKSEEKSKREELLKEFKKVTKHPIKIDPNIDIIKLDEDMYDDIF